MSKRLQINIQLILGFVFSLLQSCTYGQINLHIDQSLDQMIFLERIKGERLVKIDSALVRNGNLSFTKKDSALLPGMYRIGNKDASLIIIANEDNIKLKTSWPTLQDSLIIIESEENDLWQQYLAFRNETNMKLELLSPIISFYPNDTKFYLSARNEFINTQDSIHNWVNKIVKDESETLASHFIQADMKPKVPVDLTIEEQREFFKAHFFDYVDWNDTLLIYSNVLTNKITDYLGLYANPNASKVELEQAFSYAIDQFLPLSIENDQMYAFCLDYLVRGFERFHFDEVLLHVASNYEPPGRCKNEERKSEIEKRLDKYNQLAIGKIAPDIRLPNLNGDRVSLYEINKPYKLVLFWASWCPHCMEMLPKLNSWYNKQTDKQVEIYSVSLDFNKDELNKALTKYPVSWPVLSEYKGWESSAAIDYNVYATPTMFLLDVNNKILAKPLTYNELMQSLEELDLK